MKNLILAALIAAQTMDWWHVFCETQSDIVWSTFMWFYLAMLLIHLSDRYTKRQKRLKDVDRMLTRTMRSQR